MSPPKPLHWEQHGQLCILSIDDDQVNLMVIEQLLAPQGWKVSARRAWARGAQAARTSTVNSYQRACADGRHQIISACDGDEALDTLADEPCWPDAVLLDYTLANETGDQVRSSPCRIGKLPRQAAWCISGSSCANCWVLAALVSTSKQLPP